MVFPACSARCARRAATAGRSAAGNPRENPLLARRAPRELDGLLVRDLLDRIDQRQVEHLGNESGAQALNLVRPGLERLIGPLLAQHRAA